MFYKSCSFNKNIFLHFLNFWSISSKKWIFWSKAKLISLYRVELFTFTPILRHIEWKRWTSIKVSHRLGKHLSISFWTLKLLRDRSKFEIIFCFPLLSKLQNCWQMFWFAVHSHLLKENIHKFKIPRKNQHSIDFSHSNLKVGPFGPPRSLRVNLIVFLAFIVEIAKIPPVQM